MGDIAIARASSFLDIEYALGGKLSDIATSLGQGYMTSRSGVIFSVHYTGISKWG